ncbi:MAG: hypothetical protein DRP80_06670 [Candidatus Omnitrophota bacterium]|nr:MAG: hypothetical protein DRP69_02010 [Candidatus Omnitrophota bacterium]RKY42553.1 MAG: hypothetical protein DRP80_06670 [Candidatus Omnitrophota bacterium]
MRRLFVFFFSFFFLFPLFSQEETNLIAEGKYFSIYGYKDLDIVNLLKRLNFEYLLHSQNLTASLREDFKSLLADTLDALYLEVSDILDLHIYSYHGRIYLLKDKDSVSSVFSQYFGRSFPERSFYLHEKNSIYISCADITLGMLGHEIAHAVISHYFIVPPPAKIQEVLAGYVEYDLRKSTGTLSQ